mmetsp:Transcript_9687/g.31157  ORF Transcript_9687/g.31157 Transcript_9687/m.31157 type:complete len:118 (-) Transcript_9687:500-853(-)
MAPGTAAAPATEAPSRRRKPGKIVIDPTTNRILTTIFAVELLAIFGLILMPGVLPAGCPLSPAGAAAALVGACATVYPVIFLVKFCAGHLCAFFSRTALAHLGDPVTEQAPVPTRAP